MEWSEAKEKLYELIQQVSVGLRKGEEVIVDGKPASGEDKQAIEEGKVDKLGGKVVEIFAMPHESALKPEAVKVDVHFIVIEVNKPELEKHREEFLEICRAYPRLDRLAEGPSYIEVGGEIGSQETAFHFFAIGKVLGLWGVITPKAMGLEGPIADQMAGSGMVMITGFREE